MARFRDNYGAGPLHLLSSVAMGAIVIYALTQILGANEPLDFLIWFAGAVIAHDMISFPLYSVLGLVAGKAATKTPPNTVNYVRVPAFLSAISFVVFFPFILGVNADYFQEKTGVELSGYFEKWILLTGVLALGSAVLFAINLRRHSAAAAEAEAEGEGPVDEPLVSAGDGPVTPQRRDDAASPDRPADDQPAGD
ncbi:hypothetical protein BH10ACT11_BH10ACT11_12520 [soil metagenome]